MKNFSKIHIYSTRQNIKEKWKDWVKENRELIIEEKQNLEKNGYTGSFDDLIHKLFFSVKYYYIKKQKNYDDTSISKDNENTKIKIKFSNNIIKCIENHIHSILHEKQKPYYCYLHFINNNKENIYTEYLRIVSEYNNSINIRFVFERIKKCYENKYYIYRCACTYA